MSVQTLIRQAGEAGVALRLIDGKLKASGHSDAVAALVDQLRANKQELLDYLQTVQEREPSIDPGAWRELDQAYQVHHFNCPTCIAAGRGAMYGRRCAVGLALWTAGVSKL